MTPDVIVIGAGVNGLVCAATLARSGRRVLVVERREKAGGAAETAEIAPGFFVPRLTHATGPLGRGVLDAAGVPRGTLSFVRSSIRVSGLPPDGRPVVIDDDVDVTREALRQRSPRDAEAWPGFLRMRDNVARVIASVLMHQPPVRDRNGGADIRRLLPTLGAFRRLGRAERQTLLRWPAMSVGDLVSEAFTDDALRATLAVDGVFGAMLGPRSPWGGLKLLLAAAHEAAGDTGTRVAVGGPGRLAQALVEAVERAGGVVRTAVAVDRIRIRRDTADGVWLSDGSELGARAIVSALDPRRTLLGLCESGVLPPEIAWRLGNYRTRGALSKVNLALSALPAFAGATPDMLAGRVRLVSSLDDMERAFDAAKYGEMSTTPSVEITIPSLADPSLAPPGAHVLSAYVQWTPSLLRGRTWDDERDTLYARVLARLDAAAPGIAGLVVAADSVTPLDMEREYGLTGGDIFHGELAPDQLWIMRPVLGFARYRSPVPGLYLCGSGTHPGTGLTGMSGLHAARAVLGRT